MAKNTIGKVVHDWGPLMLIALLVPGGSLIAAVIYWLRRNGE